MNIVDIPAWIADQRATATTQAERWQGVDPSRLLEACDLIAQLLALQPAAPRVVDVPPASIETAEPAAKIAEGVLRQPRGVYEAYLAGAAHVAHDDPDPALRAFARSEIERFNALEVERRAPRGSGRRPATLQIGDSAVMNARDGIPLVVRSMRERGITYGPRGQYAEVDILVMLPDPRALLRYLGENALLVLP